MLDINIKEDELKENTREYFNIFYMNLLFSDTDTMEMEFSNAILHEDKILLVAEKIISQNCVYDTLKSSGTNSKFRVDTKVKPV